MKCDECTVEKSVTYIGYGIVLCDECLDEFNGKDRMKPKVCRACGKPILTGHMIALGGNSHADCNHPYGIEAELREEIRSLKQDLLIAHSNITILQNRERNR